MNKQNGARKQADISRLFCRIGRDLFDFHMPACSRVRLRLFRIPKLSTGEVGPGGLPGPNQNAAPHLKMLFGIFTWTPRFGLSTNWVMATSPIMLTTW
jgi:hypothetical protein